MTTEQVIKALECCTNPSFSCDECAYYEDIHCPRNLRKDAVTLIKELQGQIVGLNSAIETLQGVAKDYENHNENLRRENKYLRESLADEREHKEDMRVEAEWMVKAYKGDEIVNIPYIEHQHQYDAPFCSRCREYALLDGVEKCVASNYCPHCGAKMKGE